VGVAWIAVGRPSASELPSRLASALMPRWRERHSASLLSSQLLASSVVEDAEAVEEEGESRGLWEEDQVVLLMFRERRHFWEV
jgi:hypothetical protein